MKLNQARAIIEEAQKSYDDEEPIFEGDMPDSDEEIIEQAEILSAQAKVALADGWDDEQVETIVGLAEGDIDPPEPEDEPEDDDDPSEEDLDDLQEDPLPPPWRGYDARKMEQIIRKLPKLDDEELAEVYDYEKENKNRKGIMKALAEIAAEREPDDEEEPTTGDDASGEEGEEQPEGREPADADASEDASGEADGEGAEGEDPSAEEDEEAGYDPEHHELIKKVTARVEDEHFSIPKRLPREIVEMPFDMTKESDLDIRKLHSAFASYYARAAYVAKLEGQLADACKHIADKKHNEFMRSVAKVDPDTKKDKTATLLKAEAEADETVALWRDRERTHSALSHNSKKDAEIYEKNLSSLSREWTMRHEEFEHSGGLSKKRK